MTVKLMEKFAPKISININAMNKMKEYVRQSDLEIGWLGTSRRVGNVFYLTLFDKLLNKVISFCPARNFIAYSGHTNKSGSLNKFFSKHWFKKRYEILEFKRIKNLDELKGVTTNGDECNHVG